MQITLPPELEHYVGDLVQTGAYPTSSEVVREALRLLKERDEVRAIRLQRLQAEIQIGIDELDRGEGVPMNIDHIKAEGRKRLSARRDSNGNA